MSLRKTRLHRPGFALAAAMLALCLSAFAGNLKAAHSFNVSFPKIYETGDSGRYGLQYVGPGELAFWFTDRKQGELSKRDELLPTDPWRLILQTLDDKGKVTKQAEWPTRKFSTGLLAKSDGTVSVLTGPVLRCLSSDLVPFGSLHVSDHLRHRDFRALIDSPAGNSVWVVAGGDALNMTRVNSRTCQAEEQVSAPARVATLTVSDRVVVASNQLQFGYLTPAGFKLLYQSDQCCIYRAAFVTQGIIMALRKRGPDVHDLLAFDLKGQLLLNDRLDAGYRGENLVTSSDGRLVAVVEASLGQFPDLPVRFPPDYRVHIYELPALKRIANLELLSYGSDLFAMAISQDDAQLAVLTGSKVTIFDLDRSLADKSKRSKAGH